MDLPMRCFLRRFKRFFLTHVCLAIICGLLMGFALICMTDTFLGSDSVLNATKPRTTTLETPVHANAALRRDASNQSVNRTDLKMKWLKERIERMNKEVHKIQIKREVTVRKTEPNTRFHVFYYAWYESADYDGSWQHWNHKYLQNWRKLDKKVYQTGSHVPPHDIGSNFYPALGCYSSRNPATIDSHMKQIRDTGIGVIIVSWYPPGLSDGAGRSSDLVFSDLLNAAVRHNLKVAPHIEPYKDRNPTNLLNHLRYFTRSYGEHPALYKFRRKGKDLNVYYIYDSYRTPSSSWKELLSPKGNISVRQTSLDGIFLGLFVDVQHRHEIKRGYFDGFYTYFASNGFTYGSTWKNWKTLSVFARQNGLLFSPSIGPGYIDTRVRPWNTANTRHRRRGKYYDVGWRTAISAGPDFFSVTSFNEWHEGTQIEPAIPKSVKNYTYMDYEPEGPHFYLNLTNWWINQILNKTEQFRGFPPLPSTGSRTQLMALLTSISGMVALAATPDGPPT